MTMAGEVLTKPQRKLWKRLESGERLGALTDDELRDWTAACRKSVSFAADGPAPAAEARRAWQSRLREAESELARRTAET